MTREITILAVSRISSGVCVAGVDENGEWVRPTRPNQADTWRQLEYDDCKNSSGDWIVRKGNIIRMDLVEAIPRGDHSEDWRIGPRRPELVMELSDEDYHEICDALSEDSTDCVEGEEACRSLIIVHPDKFNAFTFAVETSWEGKRRYIPRCSFRLGRRPYPRVGISDLEWRGYGRQFLNGNGRTCNIPPDEIFAANDTDDCWLMLGRNQVASNVYLLVAGIHLFPACHFEMDFGRA